MSTRRTLLPEVLVEAIFAPEGGLSREESDAIIHAAARDPVVMRTTLEALLHHFNKTARGLDAVVKSLAKNARVRGAYVAALATHREKRARATPRAAKKNPASRAAVARARARYERDHWGQTGPVDVRVLPSADPRLPCSELGELVRVVYRTKKGSDAVLTDYDHAFRGPRPVLSYNRTGLVISGGSYTINERGIVG